MNLLLLDPDELDRDGVARLVGRRLQHAREVLAVQAGDTLRVGVLGGNVGTADVIAAEDELVLHVALTEAPPARPGIDLVLAMPRPKAFKRILPVVAQLGVDRVVLLNAARVERSYFHSPALTDGTVRRLLVEGLEQARDTVLPEVVVRERFRPFVEDELPGFVGTRLLAHPYAARGLGPVRGERVVLAVGPEGGWVPFEVELLEKAGFGAVSLGPRVLRTETLVPYLIGVVRG